MQLCLVAAVQCTHCPLFASPLTGPLSSSLPPVPSSSAPSLPFTLLILESLSPSLSFLLPALLSLDRAIAETADYCRERKAFGKSVLDNQVVHFRLAELETEVEALRSLLYRAIGELGGGGGGGGGREGGSREE